MHTYSVALAISGDDLDEAALSGLAVLKDGAFREKGEPLAPGSRSKASTKSWWLSFDPREGKPEWQSLDEGLKYLVEELQPVREVLHELGKRFSVSAYCGHFGSGFGGGPSILPETLGKLADLGLTLTIKTYWGSNEPE